MSLGVEHGSEPAPQDGGNAVQIAYWNEIGGQKWVAGQARLDALMTPLTRVLLDAAAVRGGEAILDVGCGCGETALRCAEAAGPGGRVLAVDVSQPMLARARARAAALTGAAPIEWLAADASTCTFARDRDVLLSRFGVMFFADPAAAFAAMRRSLRGGGRVALLTWRRREEVEWMRAPAEWLGETTGSDNGDASMPGPFSLSDAEATLRLLTKAGFSEVGARAVDRPLVLGADVAEAAALLSEHGPAAHIIRDAAPDVRAEAEAVLRQRLRDHCGAAGVTMAAACWLYTASA